MTNENNTPRTFSFTISDEDMVGVQELIREERARHLVSAAIEVDNVVETVITAHFMLAGRTSGLSPEDLAANDDPALTLDTMLVEVIKELDAITSHNRTEGAFLRFLGTPVMEDGLRALSLIIEPTIVIGVDETRTDEMVEDDYRSIIADAIIKVDAMQFALYQCWMQGFFSIPGTELTWLNPTKFTIGDMRQLLVETKKVLVRRGLDDEQMTANGFTSESCRNFNFQMTRLAVTLDALFILIRPIPDEVLGVVLDQPWGATFIASLLAFISGVDLRVNLPEISDMRDDCQRACAFAKKVVNLEEENSAPRVSADHSISLYGVKPESCNYPPIASVLFGNAPPIEEVVDDIKEDAEHLKETVQEAAEEVAEETKTFLGKIKNTICNNIPKTRTGRIVFGTSVVAASALGGYIGYKICKCDDKTTDTNQN